jgi:hypothetical chaperone protein
MSDTVLAIDFGTSNSLAGAMKNGRRIEALPLDKAAADPTLMRTLLFFPHQDLCFYGQDAVDQYLEHDMEGRLFRSFKSHLPNREYLGTAMNDRLLTLESMIGIFLLEMKKRAEAALGESVDRAVIGRPARYAMDPVNDNFALHRMTKAVEFAGFKSFEFVPEPLAAALDLRRHLREEKLILVADFGGGTSDFTLIKIGPFAYKKEHVLGLEGAPQAGDALDSLFMSRRLNEFFGANAEYKLLFGSNRLTMPQSILDRLNMPAHIVHLKERATYDFIGQVRKGALTGRDKAAIDRLFALIEDNQIFPFFEKIERTKRDLSDSASARFEFDYPDIEVQADFSRAEFEGWAQPVAQKIFGALDECLRQGQVLESAIDLVYLTGGTAQVPLVRHELERRFGAEKLQSQSHFHSVLSGLIEMAGEFSAI